MKNPKFLTESARITDAYHSICEASLSQETDAAMVYRDGGKSTKNRRDGSADDGRPTEDELNVIDDMSGFDNKREGRRFKEPTAKVDGKVDDTDTVVIEYTKTSPSTADSVDSDEPSVDESNKDRTDVFTIEVYDPVEEEEHTPMQYSVVYYTLKDAIRAAKDAYEECKDISPDIESNVFVGEYQVGGSDGSIFGEPDVMFTYKDGQLYDFAGNEVDEEEIGLTPSANESSGEQVLSVYTGDGKGGVRVLRDGDGYRYDFMQPGWWFDTTSQLEAAAIVSGSMLADDERFKELPFETPDDYDIMKAIYWLTGGNVIWRFHGDEDLVKSWEECRDDLLKDFGDSIRSAVDGCRTFYDACDSLVEWKEREEPYLTIMDNHPEWFSDGEEDGEDGTAVGESVFHDPEEKYFIIVKDNHGDWKIESGWEYRSDANEHIAELPERFRDGTNMKLVVRRTLDRFGLDVDNDDDHILGDIADMEDDADTM